MRIPSGKTDQRIFFVAVDATDYVTRETGLSGFTVYRSRNGGTATAYTTPSVTELDATNMPGVYSLLVDEDTTIGSTSDSQEYCVHITCTGMAPVTRTIELYRRDTTSGNTLDVSAAGNAGIDWANIENPTTAVNLSGTNIDTDQVVASVSGAVGSVTGLTASNLDVAVSTRLASASYTAPLDAAGTRAAVGLASANLDTQIDALPTNAELTTALSGLATSADLATVDGKADAIKAKTDSLTFTVANQIDANIQYVNDSEVTGAGTAGDPWGP